MDMMAYFRDVSYETLVVLFKKYFFDFMAFGYRPDEYFRFSRKYESDSKELQYLRFWTIYKKLKVITKFRSKTQEVYKCQAKQYDCQRKN